MPATSHTIDLAINQLVPSKRNVRKSKPSKQADQELLAGIRANGVLQNLVVIMSPKPGIYEVVAGKRRLQALKTLVKEGHYQDTATVPCRVHEDEGTVEEVGLIENVQRERMHPADEFQAFHKMQRNGATTADIAMHLGVPEKTVKQRLKLAQVAPAIIKAYRAGELTGGEVEAFTVEDDKQRQLEVFEQLQDENSLTAWRIRNALTAQALRGDDRLAKFVGEAAYTKAGGELSQDLFQETTYFHDTELVQELAIQKLQRAAKKLAGEWNWTEITIDRIDPYGMKRITGYDTPETEKLRTKLKDIQGKLNALGKIEFTDEWSDKHDQQEERLNAEYDKTETAIGNSLSYKPEEMAVAGCIVTVSESGTLEVFSGLIRKSDEKELEKIQTGGKCSPTQQKSSQASNSSDQGEPTGKISQALQDDLITYRLNIIKRHLAMNVDLATDLLGYTLAQDLFQDTYYSRPLEARITETRPAHKATRADTGRAVQELSELRDSLPLDWMHLEDQRERFAAYQALTFDEKALLLTYTVANALNGGMANGDKWASFPETELIAEQLDIPWHKYFTPTAENYLGRMDKEYLLNLGERFFSDWRAEGADKRSKKQLAEDLEGVFAGEDDSMPADKRAEAIDWIPAGFKPE